MVGQLTLDQHIGVRIPGGQPNKHFPASPELPRSTRIRIKPANLACVSVRRGAPGAIQNPGVRTGVQLPTKWGTTLISTWSGTDGADGHRDSSNENQASGPTRFYDRDGLFLLINPSGSKLWRWRYRFGGKEKLMALGEYPVVNLAQTRERQVVARKKLAVDLDPMAERKAEAETRQREADVRQRQAENSFENMARKCGNGGLLASLRVTLTTCCGAWKRTSSQRWVTSTLTM